MKFAYADPPYIGQAKRHYSHDPLCAEVDHKELIDRLMRDYPDGWALSLSSPSLFEIAPMCPKGARVASWSKPFASFKPGVNPAYTWEPVIFYGGRKRSRQELTVKDHLAESITLKKGLSGAKSERFCWWILDLLGYRHGDTLDDLFPGTGVMGRVLEQRRAL